MLAARHALVLDDVTDADGRSQCRSRAVVESDVAACVLEGRRPRYGAAEAAANLRTIEALYGSARAGGRVVAVAV